MIKRVFLEVLILLIISTVLMGCSTDSKITAARTEPILIFSSILINSGKVGEMYPELVVNQDGTWRKADIKDIWVGQKFNTFSGEKVETEVVVNKVPDTLPIQIKTDYVTEKDVFCFGLNAVPKQFENKATGPLIRPRDVDIEAQKELKNELKKSTVRKVLESDWENIQNDYGQNELELNIVDVMSVDLNGDEKKDYIIVLGDKTFIQNLLTSAGYNGPAAVVVYVSEGNGYKRVPLDFWEKTLKSWPLLYFIKDVIGDNKGELFMSNQTVNSSHFIIYGWFDEGLKRLYGSENVNKRLE